MNHGKIKSYIDLFFYIVFLPTIILLVPVGKWIDKYPVFAFTLIFFLYALYYAIQKMSIPRKFLQKKYWQIVLFGVIVLVITYLISEFPYPADVTALRSQNPGRNVRLRHQTVWFMAHVVIGYGLSVSLIFELFKQIIQKREIEWGKRTAELALYRAQINPHFFFNTMNSLYGLVISKSDKTEDAFIKFSNLFKYSYAQIDNDTIPIKEEVDYIKNYIDLQQLRLNAHTKVNVQFSIDNEDCLIPPMLLISFVENAYKYGTSCKQDCEINIRLTLAEQVLDFVCSNRKMKPRIQNDESSVGIKNTIARLDMLYPDTYNIDIQDTDDQYIVKLNLRLS